MTIAQSVVLGVIQGVTEFFPISSSGHLVILQALFGIREPKLAFDIFLHLGTLLAILIFFRKDILNLAKDRALLFYIITASIPTFIIALAFKDKVEQFFGMPKVVGCMLGLTGAWLVSTRLYDTGKRKTRDLGILNSIAIGIAQGIAIMPGISRSGATIATGILSGLDREKAFSFSFLLSIPAVLGAMMFKIKDIAFALAADEALSFAAGGLAAMLSGLLAVSVLLKLVKGGRLYLFGVYCIVIGLVVIVR